jgi:hypothetical protein
MAIDGDSLKGDIAIELDAENVSAADFKSALDAFLKLVRELARQINESTPRDSWLLNVQQGSQVISLHADGSKLPPVVAAKVYSVLFAGLDGLEHEAKIPEYFTESALEAARELSRVAFGKHDKGTPVRVLSRDRASIVTRNTFTHVSEILDWKYEDVGTVEGTLEVVSAHNGYEFRIFEPIWERAVRCTLDEDLLHSALAAFRKRVEVQGLVRYSRDGLPISVKALKISEFPESKDLPSFRDVMGILSN